MTTTAVLLQYLPEVSHTQCFVLYHDRVCCTNIPSIRVTLHEIWRVVTLIPLFYETGEIEKQARDKKQ